MVLLKISNVDVINSRKVPSIIYVKLTFRITHSTIIKFILGLDLQTSSQLVVQKLLVNCEKEMYTVEIGLFCPNFCITKTTKISDKTK